MKTTAAERVAEVRDWAVSRIQHCRAEEAKFGNAWQPGETQGKNTMPQTLIVG